MQLSDIKEIENVLKWHLFESDYVVMLSRGKTNVEGRITDVIH